MKIKLKLKLKLSYWLRIQAMYKYNNMYYKMSNKSHLINIKKKLCYKSNTFII